MEERSERTASLLSLRLQALARALEAPGVPREAASRLLESAAVATMHAVSLDLLSAARATEIWSEARLDPFELDANDPQRRDALRRAA